jgi:putative DNA-invertase from lambdoid prophage Rac
MPKTAIRRTTKPEQSGRVFGYARVSTEKQSSEGYSLADQEQRIQGYAQSVGLKVTEMFVEAGVSGGKRLALRPKGAQLLAKIQRGDHVIATRLDRLFRSASDALNVVEECRAKGVHLHLPDIGGDCTGNGVAKLVFSILAAVAEMEKSRIGERVRSVKQYLRESGYFTGGIVPRGFSVTKDGKLAADKNWSRCLTAMKKMRAEQMTYRQIADRIGKDFGVSLDHSTVYRILSGKRELDATTAA